MDKPQASPQFSLFRCPICQSSWDKAKMEGEAKAHPNRSLVCEKNHHFDLAKSGYVNLLPSNHKNSKNPGDDQQSVQSRLEFLETGHYDILIESLSALIDTLYSDGPDNRTVAPINILDIGCGPGYYAKKIANMAKTPLALSGIDISKPAINLATKQYKGAHFAVASSNNIPVHSQAVDLALTVFAPVSEAEVHRILKPGGHWIRVAPAMDHLKQLRALIYKDLTPIEKAQTSSEHFDAVDNLSVTVSFTQHLNKTELEQLLEMTPYRWTQQSASSGAALELPTDLSVDFSFQVQIFISRWGSASAN